MKPLNQTIHCETMATIMSLLIASFTNPQIGAEFFLVSFAPVPWHGFRAI